MVNSQWGMVNGKKRSMVKWSMVSGEWSMVKKGQWSVVAVIQRFGLLQPKNNCL